MQIYWYKLLKKIGKKSKYTSHLFIIYYIKIISNIVNTCIKWSDVVYILYY